MGKLERLAETIKVMAVVGLLVYGACIAFDALDAYMTGQMNLWSESLGM